MSTTTSTNAAPPQHQPSQHRVSYSSGSSYSFEDIPISCDPSLRHDIATEREVSVKEFTNLIFGCETWEDSVKSEEIRELSTDPTFKSFLQNYSDTVEETDLFPRFALLANYVLKKKSCKETNPIRFVRNYPAKISGSSATHRPHVIITRSLGIAKDSTGRRVLRFKKSPFHWKDIFSYVEFQLKTDKCEWVTASGYSSYSPSGSGSQSQSSSSGQSTSSSTSQSSSSTSQSSSTTAQTSNSSNKRRRSEEWPESVSKRRRGRICDFKPKLRCAGYASEMLSNGGLRTHTLGLYIDNHDLRIQYFDRSIFLSSMPFRFTENPCQLIALLFILHGLDNQQWGITPGFTRSTKPRPKSTSHDTKSSHHSSSSTLTLGNGWKLQFSRVLSQQHSLLGRGTTVIRARVREAPDSYRSKTLAIKISCPTLNRRSEEDILKLAYEKATGDFAKMLAHLPEIYHCEDIDLGLNSPWKKLAIFFDDKVYEPRAFRVFAFRELRPLYELITVDELSKAFRDIFNCYRWLYEEVNILHRDISLSNVMYYRKEGTVYGVLNDFDLAIPARDTSPSSKECTGTTPFMAYELLMCEGVPHMYRHDLESLFYVILILTSHFENGKEIENPPLKQWFSLDSPILAELKCALLLRPPGRRFPSPTPPYAAFKKWIDPMQRMIKEGITDGQTLDQETLGGNITFDNMAAIFSVELSDDVVVS